MIKNVSEAMAKLFMEYCNGETQGQTDEAWLPHNPMLHTLCRVHGITRTHDFAVFLDAVSAHLKKLPDQCT